MKTCPFRFAPGEIHVWKIPMDSYADSAPQFERCLGAEERNRAARFRFMRDRTRFAVSHYAVRDILARYADICPSDLSFESGTFGKPRLCAAGRLEFNMSHSHSIALLGISLGRPLGIDIELLRTDMAIDNIAKNYFSPAEVAALQSLSALQRVQGFFNCWTRKEAYVKAIGQGLQVPLDSFDVSLAPDQPAAFRRGVAPEWSLLAFNPESGYVAAIATAEPAVSAKLWTWTPTPQN